MGQLRTGSRLFALMTLLGVASACGSMTGSPAASTAKHAAGTARAAPGGQIRRGTASPGGSASEVIADKEHGTAVGQKPAGGKHADLLNGVSCGGTQCVAVGAWYYGVKSERTLVEMWTGKAWSLEPSPDEPSYSALGAVSCAPTAAAASVPSAPLATSETSDGCVALGTPALAGYGSQWRAVVAPGDLTAVSCTSADACVAVGTRTARTPVFATWNGTAWHAGAMHAVPPQAEQAAIAGVSCASADNCVAVGDYSYGITAKPSPAYRDRTLAEQWNGRAWRLLPTVNVSHSNALTAVSCVSPDDCTALAESQSVPLAERWNGTAWLTTPIPPGSSTGYVQLTGVSCVSAVFCVASGTQQGQPIAESWNGGEWRLTRLPLPAVDNHSAQLTGISCASTRACMAVGVDGAAASYAELYVAGRWELSATRNPL